MLKGKSAGSRNEETRTQKIQSVGGGAGVGGAETGQAAESWEFEVVELTPNALETEVGDSVSGMPIQNRIMVLSSQRALGFAPRAVALRIHQALRFRPGSLVGSVTFNQDEHLRVRLSLFESN